MPRQFQFRSHNAVSLEGQARIERAIQPIHSFAPGADHLFNSFAIVRDLNRRTAGIRALDRVIVPPMAQEPARNNRNRGRRRRVDSDGEYNPQQQRARGEFWRVRGRRQRRPGVPTEEQPAVRLLLRRFDEGYHLETPDEPCVECGTMMFPKVAKQKEYLPDHQYGITRVFGHVVHDEGTGTVAHCPSCVSNPQPPVDVGWIPECIQNLPQSSCLYFSPFRIATNLGRTSGYNPQARYFNYRTITGRMVTQPQNMRAILLYSGSLGAFLETSQNPLDRDHNLQHLRNCRDWLLHHNAVFQRHNVLATVRIENPFPVVRLLDEAGERLPRGNRQDIVMNPFDYDAETANEDFRNVRVPVGAVETYQRNGNRLPVPPLTHADPDVEVLLFPHLYPHGIGHFIPGERNANHRLKWTRHKDVRKKLSSYNRSFRDDPYWAGWSYQAMEQLRIFQNKQRLVHNSEIQSRGGRIPTNVLLQQSAYGQQNIVNESISRSIPTCIRTGEPYFEKKRYLVNAMMQSYDLPQLFITLTFNEQWPEFEDLLRRTAPTRIASDYPWEGIEYFYRRFSNLKNHLWRLSSGLAGFGKLKELVERMEFQQSGTIHTHTLLWTERIVDEMLAERYI